MPAPDSPPPDRPELPSVPGWAAPRGTVGNDLEAGFIAGAALNSLDNFVRAAPLWAGAWRQRLALNCAASAAVLAGRTEDAAQIRDAWCLRLHEQHPGYGFERHKGYGTEQHLEALCRLGPMDQHRRSFAPLRDWLNAAR